VLTHVLAVIMTNTVGAMGLPCARPFKDIRAHIKSTLDAIDEIRQCYMSWRAPSQ
jgi:hypothetical protein